MIFMRRMLPVAFLILLLSPACVSPGVRFPDWDTPLGIGGRIRGTRRPNPGPQPLRPCTELGRTRCDFLRCGGTGFDYVTYQCTGMGRAGRCMANAGCSASPKSN